MRKKFKKAISLVFAIVLVLLLLMGEIGKLYETIRSVFGF